MVTSWCLVNNPMIGILADVHDHGVNFQKFLAKTHGQPLDELWIAGDLGTSAMLAEVSRAFAGRILVVAGNVETGHDRPSYDLVARDYPHLEWAAVAPHCFSRDELKVALFHWPGQAERYAKTHQVDLVISGHTHRPNLQKIGSTWHINPGTLAGIFTPATYVLADLQKMSFTLHRLYE